MHPAECSAEERLRRIELVTDTSLAHLDVHDLLGEVLARVRDVLGTDIAAVLMLDPGEEELIATGSVGIEDEVQRGLRIPVSGGFASAVLGADGAVVFDRDDEAVSGFAQRKGIRSLAGAPMVSGGEAVGILCVGAFDDRRFGEDDAELLRVAADRMASVSQVGSSRAERIAATVLQHSLLPSRLPEVEGVSIDGRYLAGADHGIGGDWYDVFELPSGRVGVVMGDVVGHGLLAAVVMGRLRSALRAYALEDDDPARVLHKLDRKVTHFEPDAMASVAYGLYDPETARLEISLAGHLPPVLATSEAGGELLKVPVDPPVGVEVSSRERRCTTLDLPEGSVLCLFTDGLVERREQPIDTGLDALCEAIESAPARAVCTSVMERLITSASPGDDVTLLVLSRCG